ncbi:MAG: hypothetical protein FWC97_01265 [Treponema sp.]|nr:hypothetical protein [Treponema sp.]
MIRKVIIFTLAVFLTSSFASALDIDFSGQMKTGVFWVYHYYEDEHGNEASFTSASFHNNHISIGNPASQGRLRLDLNVTSNNVGVILRLEQFSFTTPGNTWWTHAFAFGNFFDDQLRFSIGRLGLSPWAAGSDDIQHELDGQLLGIRTEVFLNSIPGFSFGFTLSDWNSYLDPNFTRDISHILLESVIGVSFTNNSFHGSLAWRLDSEADGHRQWDPDIFMFRVYQEGHEMMYRAELRFLHNIIPYFSIVANGWWSGIFAEESERSVYKNWLYFSLAPQAFRTNLDLGLQINGTDSHLFTARAGFHYNVLPFLSIGSDFSGVINFGANSTTRDIPLHFFSIEPQIRVSFSPGIYAALVYSFYDGFVEQHQRMQRGHWMNLRTVITF